LGRGGGKPIFRKHQLHSKEGGNRLREGKGVRTETDKGNLVIKSILGEVENFNAISVGEKSKKRFP